MSVLRARCPVCQVLTAVALDIGYECHACGRTFPAGLVRVPKAWGEGGREMEEAASSPLPLPDCAIVSTRTLEEQTAAIARSLPARPFVLGGCCCAHLGAIAGLAGRHGRIAIVWLDAHGDLNTAETSPSGNAWGMPLRMALDAGIAAPTDVALIGARSLDPAERAYLAGSAVTTNVADLPDVLAGTAGSYLALDADVLDPGEGVAAWLPEPGGLTLGETVDVIGASRAAGPLLGAGLSGLAGRGGPPHLLGVLLDAIWGDGTGPAP